MLINRRPWNYVFAFVFSVLILLLLLVTFAAATECPAGVPSCKILILTPDEEKSLTAPGGILSTAAQARTLDLAATVQYFLLKIQNAPAGVVKLPEKAVPNSPLLKK